MTQARIAVVGLLARAVVFGLVGFFAFGLVIYGGFAEWIPIIVMLPALALLSDASAPNRLALLGLVLGEDAVRGIRLVRQPHDERARDEVDQPREGAQPHRRRSRCRDLRRRSLQSVGHGADRLPL